LSKLKRNWQDYVKVAAIWLPASGASWYLALKAGFSQTFLPFEFFDGIFNVAIVGGFVGAAIMGLAFMTISKNRFNLLFVLALSLCATIAAAIGLTFSVFFDEEMFIIMHVFWQSTVLLLIQRDLLVLSHKAPFEQFSK
jgi:hypothetical protein